MCGIILLPFALAGFAFATLLWFYMFGTSITSFFFFMAFCLFILVAAVGQMEMKREEREARDKAANLESSKQQQ